MEVNKDQCSQCPKIKSLNGIVLATQNYRDQLIEEVGSKHRDLIEQYANTFGPAVVEMMKHASSTEDVEEKRFIYTYIKPMAEVLNRYLNGDNVSVADFAEAAALGALDVKEKFNRDANADKLVYLLKESYPVSDIIEEAIRELNVVVDTLNADIQQKEKLALEMVEHCSGPKPRRILGGYVCQSELSED